MKLASFVLICSVGLSSPVLAMKNYQEGDAPFARFTGLIHKTVLQFVKSHLPVSPIRVLFSMLNFASLLHVSLKSVGLQTGNNYDGFEVVWHEKRETPIRKVFRILSIVKDDSYCYSDDKAFFNRYIKKQLKCKIADINRNFDKDWKGHFDTVGDAQDALSHQLLEAVVEDLIEKIPLILEIECPNVRMWSYNPEILESIEARDIAQWVQYKSERQNFDKPLIMPWMHIIETLVLFCDKRYILLLQMDLCTDVKVLIFNALFAIPSEVERARI
jgi:hypothetical protein